MHPEEEMETLLRGVCPQSGHWPYTKSADLYIGFRPGGEELTFSSSRVTGTLVIYDIVICARRGRLMEMETLRYGLYDALHRAGWQLTDKPGPESYNRATDLFMWPVSAKKRYAIGPGGLPESPERRDSHA